MLKALAVAALLLAMGGCKTEEMAVVAPVDDAAAFSAARRSVVAKLRDPASVQFGQHFQRKQAMGVEVVCGTVNSKNGFGGYTGQTVFAYRIADDRVLFAGEVDQSDPFRPALTLCS